MNDAIAFTYARSHSWDLNSNEGFAFNEGWAEYHSTLFQKDVHDFVESWTPLAGAQRVEGNVAQSLLKLSDGCGGGFAKIWKALGAAKQNTSWVPNRKGGVHSYQEFEDLFIAQNPGCKRIAQFCTIDPKTGQCPVKGGSIGGENFLGQQTDRCGRAQVLFTNATLIKGTGSNPVGFHGSAEFTVHPQPGKNGLTIVTWRCVQGKQSSNEQTVCDRNTHHIKVSRGDAKDRLLTIKCYHD